jgi:nucleotidyltransferase/DNA polymerase involved in DNA repair
MWRKLFHTVPPPSHLAAPEVQDVSGLIDTLSNHIGESQLYRLTPVQSDIPERAVKRVTPLSPACGASWPPHWPRPSRLLDPPEHIETVVVDIAFKSTSGIVYILPEVKPMKQAIPA